MIYTQEQIQSAADALKKDIKTIMAGSALTHPWPDSEDDRFRTLAKRMLDASGIGETLLRVQGSDVAMMELLQRARAERDAALARVAELEKALDRIHIPAFEDGSEDLSNDTGCVLKIGYRMSLFFELKDLRAVSVALAALTKPE